MGAVGQQADATLCGRGAGSALCAASALSPRAGPMVVRRGDGGFCALSRRECWRRQQWAVQPVMAPWYACAARQDRSLRAACGRVGRGRGERCQHRRGASELRRARVTALHDAGCRRAFMPCAPSRTLLLRGLGSLSALNLFHQPGTAASHASGWRNRATAWRIMAVGVLFDELGSAHGFWAVERTYVDWTTRYSTSNGQVVARPRRYPLWRARTRWSRGRQWS